MRRWGYFTLVALITLCLVFIYAAVGKAFEFTNRSVSNEDSVFFLPFQGASQGEWTELGVSSASEGGISNNSTRSGGPFIAVGQDNAPIVAWSDGEQTNTEIYIRRWDGLDWVEMGQGSASGGGISKTPGDSASPVLAIHHKDSVYIAWVEELILENDFYWEIYVLHWDGTAWTEVGQGSASGGGVSDGENLALYPQLTVTPNGVPILAWSQTVGTRGYLYVRYFDGLDWVEMGQGSASGGGLNNDFYGQNEIAMAINHRGYPTIAWGAGLCCIFAKQWNGSEWINMGPHSTTLPGIANGDLDDQIIGISLAIAPDQSPIIAYAGRFGQGQISDGTTDVYVLRWNGSTWEELGQGASFGGGISKTGSAGYPSISVAPDGTALVAWGEWGNGGPENYDIYAKYFNGTNWIEMGKNSASLGGISNNDTRSLFQSLAISRSGTPIIAWVDGWPGPEEIFVRKWGDLR